MAVSKKRKKKNAIMLISLLILCAAVVVMIIVLTKRNAEDTATTESTGTAAEAEKIFEAEAGNIIRIEYQIEDKIMVFSKTDTGSSWEYEADRDMPVTQQTVDSIVSSALSMTVQKVYAENLDKKGNFGIKEDSAYLSMKDASGNEYRITYGIQTPTSSTYYYANVGGQDRIVSVTNTTYDKLLVNPDSFASLESFPAIDKTLVMEIDYKDSNQEIVLYNEPEDLTTADAIGTTTWYYKLWDRYMATDYDEMVAILDSAVGITYKRCADFNATDEELINYGLDKPFGRLTLKYKLENTTESTSEVATDAGTEESSESQITYTDCILTILIGNKTEDESAYYILVEGDNKVYECNSELLTGFTEKNLKDTLMTLNPTLCSFDSIDEIKVCSGDKNLDLEISREQGTDSDGNATTVLSCSLNGEGMEEDAARKMFIILLKLTADHILSDDEAKEITNVMFTCTYRTTYENRPEITFTVSDYDSTYYMLTVDGHSKYVVSKQEYNTMINNLSDYWKK